MLIDDVVYSEMGAKRGLAIRFVGGHDICAKCRSPLRKTTESPDEDPKKHHTNTTFAFRVWCASEQRNSPHTLAEIKSSKTRANHVMIGTASSGERQTKPMRVCFSQQAGSEMTVSEG